MARRLALGGMLAAGFLALAPPAAAHPLGNATVSRAVAVVINPVEAQVTYVVDMAEIPAYAATLEIDRDGDGTMSPGEREEWANARCDAVERAVEVVVDDRTLVVQRAGGPGVSFPPGVGGLETLRLACPLTAALPGGPELHRLTVTDRSDDGRRGWREVTITTSAGSELVQSDVPSVSPSALLTAYPDDLLLAPLNVRSAGATYRVTPGATGAGAGQVLTDPAAAPGRADPLADLLAGPRTPVAWLLAVVVAMGLGAAHALSPGHGKALIAAYAVGSRSAIGQAVGLGLSAAASHTIGVLILGAIVLTASELLVPERVVAWLSVGSGILVVVVGGLVAIRALRTRRASHGHGHDHHHDDHQMGIPHSHGSAHPHRTRVPLHEVLALGLVGGAIPSTSALLVLLVAVATGQLIQGLLLILSFGCGMAIVLGGLAAVTGLAGSRLSDLIARSRLSAAHGFAGAAPLASAVVIMAVGAVTAIGALGSL